MGCPIKVSRRSVISDSSEGLMILDLCVKARQPTNIFFRPTWQLLIGETDRTSAQNRQCPQFSGDLIFWGEFS